MKVDQYHSTGEAANFVIVPLSGMKIAAQQQLVSGIRWRCLELPHLIVLRAANQQSSSKVRAEGGECRGPQVWTLPVPSGEAQSSQNVWP